VSPLQRRQEATAARSAADKNEMYVVGFSSVTFSLIFTGTCGIATWRFPVLEVSIVAGLPANCRQPRTRSAFAARAAGAVVLPVHDTARDEEDQNRSSRELHRPRIGNRGVETELRRAS
jgi:hypothetical protein